MLCFSTLLATPAMLPTPICDPPAPAPPATEPGTGLALVTNLRIMSPALARPACRRARRTLPVGWGRTDGRGFHELVDDRVFLFLIFFWLVCDRIGAHAARAYVDEPPLVFAG